VNESREHNETRRRRPEVSVVVANWNGGEIFSECVESILEHTRGTTFELILVDNGSTDGSREAGLAYAIGDPRVTAILNDRNLYFARACNQGFAASRGRYIVLANNDIVLRNDAVTAMVEFVECHKQAAVVSPFLVGPDDEPQEIFRRLPNAAFVLAYYHRLGRVIDRAILGRQLRNRYLYRDLQQDRIQTVEQPGASFIMIRRETIDQLGYLFDESYPLLMNDVDLARRIRSLGAACFVLPDVQVIHLGGVSSAKTAGDVIRRIRFAALFRYFRINHPLQYLVLCVAWPHRWFANRRHTRGLP
jgi:GT2 family glycosyltransferase